MMRAVGLTLLSGLALLDPALAGQNEDLVEATAAFDRGEYAAALALMRPLADQGNAAAQVRLGLMYARGHGVPRDDAGAVRWYRKAAESGYAWGQTNLGYMYSMGRGVAKDDARAVEWYRMAAEQDFAMAQDNLGVMYRDGRGVTQDAAVAVDWFRTAATSGFSEGQNNLGGQRLPTRSWPRLSSHDVLRYFIPTCLDVLSFERLRARRARPSGRHLVFANT